MIMDIMDTFIIIISWNIGRCALPGTRYQHNRDTANTHPVKEYVLSKFHHVAIDGFRSGCRREAAHSYCIPYCQFVDGIYYRLSVCETPYRGSALQLLVGVLDRSFEVRLLGQSIVVLTLQRRKPVLYGLQLRLFTKVIRHLKARFRRERLSSCRPGDYAKVFNCSFKPGFSQTRGCGSKRDTGTESGKVCTGDSNRLVGVEKLPRNMAGRSRTRHSTLTTPPPPPKSRLLRFHTFQMSERTGVSGRGGTYQVSGYAVGVLA